MSYSGVICSLKRLLNDVTSLTAAISETEFAELYLPLPLITSLLEKKLYAPPTSVPFYLVRALPPVLLHGA